MNRAPRLRCFAACAPGLEPLLAAELIDLGVRANAPTDAGVSFTANTRQLYAANLWSRIASRIVVRIAEFTARTFEELERHADEIDWSVWLGHDLVPDFRVTAVKSRLYHTGAVAERLERSSGVPSRPNAKRQRFTVRLVADRVSISADSSGDPLHKRGWRPDGGKAPVRETLAAAMLVGAGWDGTLPLVDPFCGSGTIPIEAAAIARDLAPGRGREFAFANWPTFEPGTWASVAGAARARAKPSAAVAIVGSDRDEGAIERARDNAARAGVEDDVAFDRWAISDVEPPAGPPGWILTNPPYGKRVSERNDLRDLYSRVGQVARTRFGGWSIGLLVADRQSAAHAGLPFEERWHSSNGPIPVQFVTAAVSSDHRGKRRRENAD